MDRITPLNIAAAAVISPAEAAAVDPFQAHIKEAAQRFGIPEKWIAAAIMAENSRDPSAGPGPGSDPWGSDPWGSDSLGSDPCGPRPNMLAATVCLKAMDERFGSLFAACNAGQVEKQGRYGEPLRAGKPLSAETRACAAGTREASGGTPETTVTNAKPGPSPTQNSPKIAFDTRLFLPVSTRENSDNPARNGKFFVPLSAQKQNGK